MLRRRPSGIDHQASTFNAKFACFRVIKVFKNEHNWNPFQCKEFLLVLFTKINYLKLFFPFQCTESASVLFKSTAKEERCLQASPRSSSSYVARCFVAILSYPYLWDSTLLGTLPTPARYYVCLLYVQQHLLLTNELSLLLFHPSNYNSDSCYD